MVQEENSQQSLGVVDEQILVPKALSPQWNSYPVSALDISLNIPYSLEEWDEIVATFTQLLAHKEYPVWHTAINRLICALEMEESQHSNCDDYQPTPTHERLRNLLTAIVTQTPQKPEIFDIFCHHLQFLAEEAPYQHLVLEWLDQNIVLNSRGTLNNSCSSGSTRQRWSGYSRGVALSSKPPVAAQPSRSSVGVLRLSAANSCLYWTRFAG
ncbi:MAG: hypothetical protein VKJ24_13460 [Synechococcales bacterium]|nr:hypothetical protein [Synechococcales bacterium]